MKNYSVKIVREPGIEPVSGQFYDHAEQEISIEATSLQHAYQISFIVCKILFRGQTRRTFIDGIEYLNKTF